MPTPTIEQQNIFTAMRESNSHMLIDAKAGTGKTTTLVMGLELLKGRTLILAFNKSISEELKARVSQQHFLVAGNTNVSTVHAHGLRALKAAGHKPQVQGGKLNFLLRDEQKSLPPHDPARRNSRLIARLADHAKSNGFDLPLGTGGYPFPSSGDQQAWEEMVEHYNMETEIEGEYSVPDLISDARDLIRLSNKKLGMIDFSDMVYLPLLLGCPIPQYMNVLIDEAQDISTTRRELAFRSLLPAGRIIAVGDPNQAIYGFTGADAKSLDNIAKVCERISGEPTTRLPLSICWRCDGDIIKQAKAIVPGIEARPGATEGLVDYVAFRKQPIKTQQGTTTISSPGEDFLAMPQPGDAILCRLNKPNVATALGLLRRGKPARIEGRDIGRKLQDHLVRGCDLYSHQPLRDSLIDVEAYRDNEAMKLASKNRESAAELLRDEVDATLLLMERCIEQRANATFADFEALITSLFGDDVAANSCITLSSVHKAKGREWPHVFILGRGDYMPFFKAEMDWELQQEQNLIYVAITRAERHLTYVTGVAEAISKGLHREPPLQEAS